MIASLLSLVANHLWQSTLFAAAAAFLTLFLRANRAEVRYWVWLAASVKFLVPFSLLVMAGGMIRPHTVTAIPTSPLVAPAAALSSVMRFTTPVPQSRIVAVPGPDSSIIPAVLTGVWAIGFVTLVLRWALRWRRMRAGVGSATPFPLPIQFPVRSSPAFGEPGVFGVIRPVLLLPDGIADALTPRELGAVVVHELCHIRRGDNLAGVVHMVVEALFWFHPLVWWLGARLMDERERACDEEVLRRGIEPHVYAEGILKICELYLASPLACVAGVTGGDLKRRVEAILSNRVALRLTYAKKAILAVAGLAALAAPVTVGVIRPRVVLAQTPEIASPALPPLQLQYFNVASIKPIRGGQNRPLNSIDLHLLTAIAHNSPKGRFQMPSITLALLIQLTYGLQDFRLLGGPSWINSDRYEVVAKTDRDLTFDQMRPMLHSLLVERFKLEVHKETKELPIYQLTVAKGGLKIEAAKDGSCVTVDPWNPPPPPKTGGLIPPLNACGQSRRQRFPDKRERIDHIGITMPTLLDYISEDVGRLVYNNTHFYEKFDLHLEFLPSASELTGDGVGSGVPIATALQEQLGLRLESGKAHVEVFVIDHVERPSEN